MGVGRGCAGGGHPVTAQGPGPLCLAVLAYMQLLEDYSEPQPSMFYQTPQNEHIYQQKNKLLMEVYGFNDSFSTEAPQELAPPPALPPKQRQLVSPPRLPGRRACRAGSHRPLLLPLDEPTGRSLSLPGLPARGGGAVASPAAPAAGPGLYPACLLSLLTVSWIFSLFFGSTIDLPERRDSIEAQGTVCVWPSVALIYIMASLHRLTYTPPWPGTAPWKQALLEHDGLKQSSSVFPARSLPPPRALACEDSP